MTRRLRTVLFAPHFAEYSTRLAEALSDHAEVMLILNREDRRRQCDDAWFRRATSRIKVVEFTIRNRIWRWVMPSLLMMRARLFRPEVVHVQEQADVVTARFARGLSRRAKAVVTVHDPKPHSGADSDILKRGAQRFRDAVRATADLFHVHGGYCEREFLALDASRPVVSTYHGVIHVPEPGQISEPEPTRILFFGRMEAYKGLSVLLDAIDLLNAEKVRCELVVAGRGNDLDRLRARAEATLGVTVLDHFLAPDEVIGEFQKAAVVVLPYLDATQSGVAAAAIANGRPMVASDIGGLSDVVQHDVSGLIVPPADARALAEALRRILTDSALRARLTEGAAQARDRLSWTAAADQVAGAYGRLTTAKVPRGAGAAAQFEGKPKLAFYLPGLAMGGAERHTIDLRRRLAALGYPTELISHSDVASPAVQSMSGAEDAKILGLRGMSSLSGWPKIYRAFRESQADVIFCINEARVVWAVILRALGATRAKIVCIFHTTLPHRRDELRVPLFRAAVRRADAIVYVSRNQQKYWEGRGLAARRNLAIVNGVELQRFTASQASRAEAKVRMGLSETDYVIGLLATFRPEKNHVELVEAAARLRDAGVQAKIMFVGDGPTRPAVEARVAELALGGSVLFAGEHADVRPIIAAFDVGVLCSLSVETFSLAALELLATGVPMVMTNIGGASEIVEHGVNGFLYERGDTGALVRHLAELADPRTRAEFQNHGRRSVEQYSIERMLGEYVRLVGELKRQGR